GLRKNLELVRTLRETLGPDAELMFDCVQGWDLPFALDAARGMMAFQPTWLEEPLPAGHVSGFARLKRETGVPLAAGEHLYTRWDVKPYLEAGALDYVQADPDWTGGITELTKICALAAAYDARVVPHGHHVIAALHVVASQSPGLCPKLEFLLRHLERMQFFQKTILRPENGWLPLPTAPGLGIDLDESKIESRRALEWS
ncbi:MAG: mandelate racemase, partial [Candidatus Sumerlaeota bacterium]|nr:mandelate racemase [Candidatus Sumerlaeota bacterium]